MIIKTPSELGQLLRARRIETGISQSMMASLTGVDQGNLSKIERGAAKATLETYLRICAALGVDLVAIAR